MTTEQVQIVRLGLANCQSVVLRDLTVNKIAVDMLHGAIVEMSNIDFSVLLLLLCNDDPAYFIDDLLYIYGGGD